MIKRILIKYFTLRRSQLACPEQKNNELKISLKSLRKRLQNLIKKSHEPLLVFSVKVKCHVQKVLYFNVSKEVCNCIPFFM